ncbi:MAG: hypothetical protein ACLRT4_02945 [Thomasclavelia sp.]
MKCTVSLNITADFYFTGNVIFNDLTCKQDWFMINNGYQINDCTGTIIDQKQVNQIYRQVLILHQENLSISFSGNIVVPQNTSQTKTENYLEADIQSAIIPLFVDIQKYDFEVFLTLPDQFKAVGYKLQDDHYYQLVKNAYTITLIIYHQDYVYQYCKDNVSIFYHYYHDLNKIKQMAVIANEIYESYTNLFGSCDYDHLDLVLNPRYENGAYVRNNLICLVDRIEGLDQDTYLHLSHEISHLWWSNGNLDFHDNWINETFAQFSGLLLLKEKYGNDAYNTLINQYKTKTQDMISLKAVDETTKDRFAIHYYKGPYLFDLLTKQIGQTKMLALLNKCYLQRIKSSEEFLQLCPEFTPLYKK